jgi:hypothetical protein
VTVGERDGGQLIGRDQRRPPISAKRRFVAVKIDEAGQPKRCVTHGLRKAAARRLAEAGCTATDRGYHRPRDLQEVSRYTKVAKQKKLA